MPVIILIPEPTSGDAAYNRRALPQYLSALEAAGASPIVVPLSDPQDCVARLLAGAQGVLLPGSGFDVDPERYGEMRIPECGPADAARTAVDELLLQDAFNLRKPVLGICHGAQTLNVWRNGSLIQDLKTNVNHRPGREVGEAHPVRIAKGSRLSRILPPNEQTETRVDSSHHQAVRTPGDSLVVSAVSSHDGVIEAIEMDDADHFVLAVQWHPEQTYTESAASRSIFAAFVRAATDWRVPRIPESVTRS